MSNSNLAEKLKRREQENREILEAAGELVSSKISKSGNFKSEKRKLESGERRLEG